MKNSRVFLFALLCLALVLVACSASEESSAQKPEGDGPQISGQITAGLRHITFDPRKDGQKLLIYRGDYVVPEIQGGKTAELLIPELKVHMKFPLDAGEKTYFKVPATGTYAFEMGGHHGVIEAIEYTAATYQEVSALEAVELIKNRNPLILDVRTEREYGRGHIANSQLIPVGVFQNRLDEIKAAKDDPIFVYCRSGNRSTVASRMLIDAGYKQVINLRHGINDWTRQKLPLKR